MTSTLTGIVLPVFGIVLAAFAVARMRPLPAWLTLAVNRAAFDFLVPVLLFRTLATVALPDTLPVAYFFGYYGATLVVYALVWCISQRLPAATDGAAHGAAHGVAAKSAANVSALCATYSNSVLLGIPLILRAFGDEASVPLFGLVALHSPLLFIVTSLVHEFSHGGSSVVATLRTAGKRLVANPILIGIASGLAVNVLQVPLPAMLLTATDLVRSAALPVALIAMGFGLAAYRLRGALPAAAGIVSVKLLLHPLAVAAAMALTGAPPLWREVAVVMAALPSGINVYLFASRFGAGQAASATAILASTLLSIGTLTLLLDWLR